MKCVLIRHPPPEIAAGLCYGRTDPALSDQGRAALPGLAEAIRRERVAVAWTSPARRCRAVAEACGLPMRLDARLLELDFGDWEGVAWDSVPRAALDRWAADPLGFAPPGGETGAALIARVSDLHRALVAEGRDCAVISHGGPLRLLAALLRGAPPDLLAPAPAQGSVQVLVAGGSS